MQHLAATALIHRILIQKKSLPRGGVEIAYLYVTVNDEDWNRNGTQLELVGSAVRRRNFRYDRGHLMHIC
jgi:hypothetical protein